MPEWEGSMAFGTVVPLHLSVRLHAADQIQGLNKRAVQNIECGHTFGENSVYEQLG
jgi:hypothetical protein